MGSLQTIHEPRYVIAAAMVGLGATLLIDLAMLLKRGFDVPSLNYCLLGRWLLHMPGGTIVHRSIAAAQQKPHECALGWVDHYLIGATFAVVFVFLASGDWLEHPTLLPALRGAATTLVPYLVMQPSFGLGVAGSKTSSQPGQTEEPDDPHGIRSGTLPLRPAESTSFHDSGVVSVTGKERQMATENLGCASDRARAGLPVVPTQPTGSRRFGFREPIDAVSPGRAAPAPGWSWAAVSSA